MKTTAVVSALKLEQFLVALRDGTMGRRSGSVEKCFRSHFCSI